MPESLITHKIMINCWHSSDGSPFRQTDLNHNIKNYAIEQVYDINVPHWLQKCELTNTVFDYTPDLNIFPPCLNFFGDLLSDRVIVLGIRLENAQGVLSQPAFVQKSLKNISIPLSGTPRGIDNMLPVAWIGYESFNQKIYVNNNQISGYLRNFLDRKQMTQIHLLLLDFLYLFCPDKEIRITHHSNIQKWIKANGKPGQRYMQFPYTSRVMKKWGKIEEQGWLWWVKPSTH